MENPEKFSSPLKNKMIYLQKGLACLNGPSLHGKIEVFISRGGEPLHPVSVPEHCRSIILLNIHSYAAGTKISKDTDHCDNLIEVIFTSGLTRIGLARMGLKAKCSHKADHVVLKTKGDLPFQVDGEPWIQPPSLTAISYHCNRPILTPHSGSLSCGSTAKTKKVEHSEQ